ncbi:unnamed protein product [Linum trigynum]|uniref:Uncharacterized protein n=1 Tax=Linum trigynum TaxID=586398 RepID=A0AAV2G8G4_9ROSI
MECRLHPLQLQRHARRLLHLPLPLLQHRPPRRLRSPRLPLQHRRRRGGDLRPPKADAATGHDGSVGGDAKAVYARAAEAKKYTSNALALAKRRPRTCNLLIFY